MTLAPNTADTADADGAQANPTAHTARGASPRPGKARPPGYPGLVERVDLTAMPDAARAELHALARHLQVTYRGSDGAALRGQRQHEVIVLFVGLFGTLAALLAVAKLAEVLTWYAADWVEPGAVVNASEQAVESRVPSTASGCV
jgi:hypothetical protein